MILCSRFSRKGKGGLVQLELQVGLYNNLLTNLHAFKIFPNFSAKRKSQMYSVALFLITFIVMVVNNGDFSSIDRPVVIYRSCEILRAFVGAGSSLILLVVFVPIVISSLAVIRVVAAGAEI